MKKYSSLSASPEPVAIAAIPFEQYLAHLEQNGYSFDFSYLLDADEDKIFTSQATL